MTPALTDLGTDLFLTSDSTQTQWPDLVCKPISDDFDCSKYATVTAFYADRLVSR